MKTEIKFAKFHQDWASFFTAEKWEIFIPKVFVPPSILPGDILDFEITVNEEKTAGVRPKLSEPTEEQRLEQLLEKGF